MEPFLAQIVMFGGNFAPRGWAFCEGQLLAISQYTAVFSLLGTTYGGDGRVTFGLPDFRGRVPMHSGTGPGLPTVRLGAKGGYPTTVLTAQNLPAHTHTVNPNCSTLAATSSSPDSSFPALDATGVTASYAAAPNGTMGQTTSGVTGNNTSFSNQQPYLCVSFIIALQGVFPSRS